jgi:predicted anti-sigma-YlaC factor YlaD
MEKSCKYFEEMLVDYAEGQLSPGDSSEVSRHLAECERCRALLDGLQKSLDLAGVIWTDGLAETEQIRAPGLPKTTKTHWLRYAAVAASILIVLTAFVIRRAQVKPERPEVTLAQIERKIAESATAARLLAAADLLAECPGARSIANQQYRYIAETYPETTAASKARLRMQ